MNMSVSMTIMMMTTYTCTYIYPVLQVLKKATNQTIRRMLSKEKRRVIPKVEESDKLRILTATVRFRGPYPSLAN